MTQCSAQWRKVNRGEWLAVCPKSKFVIGPFKNFVHAWLHLRRSFKSVEDYESHRPEFLYREDWFIVLRKFWPDARFRRNGWVELMKPFRMRRHWASKDITEL